MNKHLARALGATLVSLLASTAMAASFASSASSAGSNVVGSLSDSVNGSSNSSAGDKKAAAGAYRIEQVAEVAGKPGHVRLHLQAAATPGVNGAVNGAGTGTLTLDLPRQAVLQQGLGVQALIELRERPYGMEVALAAAKTGFFLLLKDDAQNDLSTRAVTL